MSWVSVWTILLLVFPLATTFLHLCGEAGQAINYFYPWSPDYNRRGEQIANLGKVDHFTLKKKHFCVGSSPGQGSVSK